MRINVSGSGAVMLDNVVSCDGFINDCPIRVQTHVHEDHMSGFCSSKGRQDMLMSEATLDLLIAEFNADIPYRSNFKPVPLNKKVPFDNCEIQLLDSGHMLGSVQVQVTLSDGLQCGYSGDFAWPLDDVIEVEQLVLDSTYGSPDSRRRFSQEEANYRFIELVVDRLRTGPVMIRAHRGTLQRAISCLDHAVKDPFIVNPRLFRELGVYRSYGYSLTKILEENTAEAQVALSGQRYIRLYETRDRFPSHTSDATSIVLSAYLSRLDNPVMEYSEKSYCVALSSHADYEETLEYVRATRATKVIADCSRGGHGIELANALRRELGIDAKPSKNKIVREWGR